jgi:hypothetical protein
MPTPPPTSDTITLWHHYEEIAMHFNSLIMQFRLEVIGGAGALGTLASYLIGGKVIDPWQQNWLRALVSSGLWVLIVAAAILDLGYYDRLLRGAVNALLDFEKQHPGIQMSVKIEETVGRGKYAVWLAYGLMLGVLLGFVIWSWSRFLTYPASNRQTAAMTRQHVGLVMAFTGAVLLAFSLRVKSQYEGELAKTIRSLLKDGIALTETRIIPALFWGGLVLVALGTLLQW